MPGHKKRGQQNVGVQLTGRVGKEWSGARVGHRRGKHVELTLHRRKIDATGGGGNTAFRRLDASVRESARKERKRVRKGHKERAIPQTIKSARME